MKQLLIVPAALFIGFSTQAYNPSKILTCENIKIVTERFEQCRTDDSAQHGGTQLCGSEQLKTTHIDRIELISNPLGLNDFVTSTMGGLAITTFCEKDFIGGQFEIVCKLQDNITFTYLPSSYEFNDYRLAFFVGSRNSPSATASNIDSNCTLEMPQSK